MTTSILSLAESMTLRPRMYTPNGSFPEVIAFLRGYVSGVARVDAQEPLVAEWEAFEAWLASRTGTAPAAALDALLVSAVGEPNELFAGYLRQYRQEHLSNR